METLSLNTVCEYAHGVLRQGDPCLELDGIVTDSRLGRPGVLFLALRGEHHDGHRFVADCCALGASGAIVEKDSGLGDLPPGFALIEVEDTLLAYQSIAASYLRTLSARVICITGSNGKTSTKDFTAAVLGQTFRVLKTEGNFNNHIGVPLTILNASKADEIIVLEMGMNHPGEIAPLARIARPDVGIITNIGTAHIEFMGSRAGIAQEKGCLAEAVGRGGCVILPAGDEFFAALAARTCARVIKVGSADSDLRAEAIEQDLDGSHFTVVAGSETARASVPVPGRHMVTNALMAIAAGQACGMSLTDCVAGLADTRLTKGRMERKNVRGFQILDDSYNANPDSTVAALETLAHLPTARRRIAVLGKMAELGQASEAGHRRVGEAAVAAKIDYVVGVGSEATHIVQSAREAGHEHSVALPGTEQAAEWLNAHALPGDLILVKGSRSATMENIITGLEKLHGRTDVHQEASVAAVPSHAP